MISESNVVDIEYSKCIKLKSKDKSYTYDSVLISCGGLAGLELNYNDSLYPVLKKQTYKIVKPLAEICRVGLFGIKRLKKTEGVL